MITTSLFSLGSRGICTPSYSHPHCIYSRFSLYKPYLLLWIILLVLIVTVVILLRHIITSILIPLPFVFHLRCIIIVIGFINVSISSSFHAHIIPTRRIMTNSMLERVMSNISLGSIFTTTKAHSKYIKTHQDNFVYS